MFFIPICCEFGSPDNPCRCKIIGPTFAFIMMVLFAIVCWPCGAIIWCCARKAGNSLFEAPFRYYIAIKDAIPF
eukprot:jgi/Astpho2/6235/Aster-03641